MVERPTQIFRSLITGHFDQDDIYCQHTWSRRVFIENSLVCVHSLHVYSGYAAYKSNSPNQFSWLIEQDFSLTLFK